MIARLAVGASAHRPSLPRPASLLAVSAATLAALAAGWVVTQPQGGRLVLAAAVAFVVGTLAFAAPRTVLVLLVVWLAALGTVRRLASELDPVAGADPMILVAPFGIAALVLVAARAGAFQSMTRLSKGVLVLSILIAAGALNPLQESILSGVAGLLFVLVPTLAFWVGRGLCDDGTLRTVLQCVAALAVAAAVYGLFQTFRGFPSWDATWIQESQARYASLDVLGTVRPFASFSGAAEYGFFLAIGMVVWLAFGLTSRRLAVVAVVVALLGVAVFYQSSRGVAVALIASLGLIVAARRGFPLVGSLVVGALFLGLLVAGAQRIAPSTIGQDTESRLAAHQVRGLADPLNPESSTLLIHLTQMRDGLEAVASEPLGIGLGPVTIAGQKFGGLARGTEADPSNAAVALGVPGLLAYMFVLVAAFQRAYGLARVRPDALSLAALGILGITLFQWLNGGQYAVAFLPWLVLGWADRRYVRRGPGGAA
jgi:hypothetical protein